MAKWIFAGCAVALMAAPYLTTIDPAREGHRIVLLVLCMGFAAVLFKMEKLHD